MKISRFKKSHKTLTYFAANFNYREPYQVLIDATFCQTALQNKVIIEEQLQKYFQSQVKLVTTQCIILESESLGPPLAGATMIVKKFYVHKCGHEGKPVAAAECIKAMTKDSRYIVASQDRTLQNGLRKIPGRCLLYLHKATPVLEAPSESTKKYVMKKAKNSLLPVSSEKKIEHLKKVEGVKTAEDNKPLAKKRKGRKQPNPLSCKKSKKLREQIQSSSNTGQRSEQHVNDKSKSPMKAKRKRIKVPAHIKQAIQSNNN